MKPQDREQLRLSLLRFLDAAAEVGRPSTAESLLLQMAKNEGRNDLTAGELRGELLYLADKGLILSEPKFLSPENKFWRITADGRDQYAQLTN